VAGLAGDHTVRLGVFGGTFDPPHLGHLILAGEALDQLKLDRLLWVLTSAPPHKSHQFVSPTPVRLELLQAVLGNNPDFELSRVDIDRPAPHYAADTVQLLRRQYPETELIYLMGGDSLRDLPTWYRPQEFLDGCTGLGVMRRPGDEINLERLDAVLPGIAKKIQFINSPLLEISSKQIRERIHSGHAYRYYLPDTVFRLIDEKRLYL
jgi:nicotinate-nucleotide adenylyltransferase